MTILGNALALILVLSVLVVAHEFGHFAVAKAFRFPVEVFSVGFGKRLFGRRVRGTDYRVSAIPLGGYVRVVGLGPDESTLTEGTSTEAPPVGRRWQRALILLAGPAMNVLLAWTLYSTVFAVGTRVPAYQLEPPVIRVVQPGSPGEAAGFRPGRPHRVHRRAGDAALERRGIPLRHERAAEIERGSGPRRRRRVPVGDAARRDQVRFRRGRPLPGGAERAAHRDGHLGRPGRPRGPQAGRRHRVGGGQGSPRLADGHPEQVHGRRELVGARPLRGAVSAGRQVRRRRTCRRVAIPTGPGRSESRSAWT